MAKGELTYKQRLFVEAFLGDANGNATEAARIAGYGSAHVAGAQNLAKPIIRRAVASRVAGAALSANEVLARLSVMATTDMTDFVSTIEVVAVTNEAGDVMTPGTRTVVLDLAKAKDAKRFGSVKKISQGQHGLSIELYDAQSALVQLGKYHGLWQERISVEQRDVPTVAPDEAAAAIAAAKAVRDAREVDPVMLGVGNFPTGGVS